MSSKLSFTESDFPHDLPPPGFYSSTISSARFRLSQNRNRMLVVVHALEGIGPPHDHVPDYFTIEGVSARGLTTARQRLVSLYQACGLHPCPGEPIEPADLFQARLEVKIEHDPYDGRVRLKAVGYHPLGTHRDQPPF